MNARTATLLASLAFIGLLAFLTVSVAVTDGVTPLVVLSFGILAMFGIGVIGALTTPPEK
jgi:hypothetical protein